MTGTLPQDAGALLAELASFAPEAVVIATDRAGRVVQVSGPARDRLWREGQPGLHVTELLAAGDAHGVTALLAGAPGRVGPRLVNLVDASGELFTVRAVLDVREDGLLLAGLRIVDEESRLGAELVRLNNELVAATRESARKGRELEKALAELRRHRDRLEELVAERTSQLVLANDGLRSEIAARDRAETRRREAEERWQFALEGSGDGVWDWDVASGVVFFSRRWKEMLGYSVDEIGSGLDEWERRLHPEDLGRTLETVGRHLRGETPLYESEHRVACKDGGYRWILDRGMVVARDAEGRPLRVIGTHTDMTLRHQAEEALRESHQRLESANRELARAARMKDEFLAAVSHELRTPLGAILGMAAQLRGEPAGSASPRVDRLASVIEASGQQLLGLVNDLIDLARIEAGKVAADPVPNSLHEVGEIAVRRYRPLAAEKRLDLSLAVEPPGLQAATDGRLLVRLLEALLSNAVKFTPEGGRAGLQIRGDRAAGLVRLTVWDTGIGIAREHLDRVFETFVQLDGRTEREYGGTGLGLALVERLARLLGGAVEVRSEPGRGSRFTLSLPATPDGAPGPTGQAGPAEAASGPVPEAGPEAPPVPFAARIPDDLRSALHGAIVRADLDEVSRLAERVADHDAQAGRQVAELVERFDYESLLAALAPAGPGQPGI